ncbi:helix-turn-helix domain-containing protein [Frankia sp. Cppng1_Ct_nod]|uniref:helix-turn-helix domain-containing protein n=1 Tax=Frankia sp. Cppng1_Ct_nod TaxID=2897162 RepID=UPI001041955F|nr:helix-turn-helix domain-containing protein [Frankia sp. Cppng1_Ct_nod]
MTVDATGPDRLTTGQAAALLGTSRQHVVDLCRQGLLPFETVGTHRRLHRKDVDAFAGRALTREAARALWLHHAVAGRLVLDPGGTMTRARSNLDRLRQVHPTGMTARWLTQWQDVLDAGVDTVLDVLTSRSQQAVELRQNSPFAGVLPERDRLAALAAFRAWWRKDHVA